MRAGMGVRRGEHQDINESLYVGLIHLSTALVSWARERERFLTFFWGNRLIDEKFWIF